MTTDAKPAHIVRAHGVQSKPQHIDQSAQDRSVVDEHAPGQSELLRFIDHRLTNDDDVQIMITGPTGSGKTSLGVSLAEQVESTIYGGEWDATDAASVGDFGLFKNNYLEREPKQVVMLDELEAVADKRRANSSSNVDLSQMLAQLRFMNVCSIFTAPVTTMIDSRIISQVDVWIQVRFRGFALPHYVVHVDEPENPRWYTRLMHTEAGYAQIIEFNDLTHNRNKNALDRMKADHPGLGNVKRYGREELKQEKKQASVNTRAEIAAKLLQDTDINQYDIANLVDRTQGWVSNLNNGRYDQFDLDETFPLRA